MTPTKELEHNDIVIGDDIKVAFVKTLKSDTGYPFNLTENQVTRLIYFFGSRRISSKFSRGDMTATRDFTSMEKRFIEDAFNWFGYVVTNPDERKTAYKAVTLRFRNIMVFLKKRPAFITKGIKEALETGGYKGVLKNIVMVVDEHRRLVPRIIGNEKEEKNDVRPVARLDTMLWDFQNIALDKLMLIIESIEPTDIKKANLGTKAKALRDIYAVVHMLKQGTKNPNMTFINFNVGNSTPTQKLSALTSYVAKNRETSNT